MIETLINILGFAICLGTLIVHQMHLNFLGKSMGDLKDCLLQEDAKINENFEKIHNDLNLVEREINQVIVLTKTQHKKHPNVFKPINKKFQKFLTPKGKIKKQYRDNHLAQECYEKFQALKQI